MTIVRCDAEGLSAAADALALGAAVILPTPSPLPYAVTACSPTAVNTATRRPADRAVAVWLVDNLRTLRPYLALNSGSADLAAWLLAEELLTVLVPLAVPDRTPCWLSPAVRDGYALLAGPRLKPLAVLHDAVTPLYVSSGNLTGDRPAVTARDADMEFRGRHLVIDGDEYRDPFRPHGSSTMVRLNRDGELQLVRSGVQNAHRDPTEYVHDVRQRHQRQQR